MKSSYLHVLLMSICCTRSKQDKFCAACLPTRHNVDADHGRTIHLTYLKWLNENSCKHDVGTLTVQYELRRVCCTEKGPCAEARYCRCREWVSICPGHTILVLSPSRHHGASCVVAECRRNYATLLCVSSSESKGCLISVEHNRSHVAQSIASWVDLCVGVAGAIPSSPCNAIDPQLDGRHTPNFATGGHPTTATDTTLSNVLHGESITI